MPAIMSLEIAHSKGYDDFIYFNQNEELTESGTANFLWLDLEGNVNTCTQQNNALAGVCLEAVDSDFKEKGTKLFLRALSRNSVKISCKAGVLISSIRGARPIASIDDVALDSSASIKLSKQVNSILGIGA
jgi:branched-subunit amino acid aminotransferase/4-amino-4-deoxychorismate lyase